MLRVLSVIGTRPEAIKMAPVVREMKRHEKEITSIVCVTGQHRRMLDQVLGLFDLRPDVDLNLMTPGQSLAQITAATFSALDGVIRDTKPDWILAQGDTTTVMVAAMTAFYSRTPFGHVEAGLRSGDLSQPFPEEMNRRVADQLADLLFAPTAQARDTLLREGTRADKVHMTGNTVIDALLAVSERDFDWSASPLPDLSPDDRLVLITAHRRESFGAPFQQLCAAFRELALRFGPVPGRVPVPDRVDAGFQFVYPVHLNPNVREVVHERLSGLPNMHLIEPVDYATLVNLMKRSTLILTDSGGIQEEAPALGIPVLVLRNTTERPEGIEANVARLVGTDAERIVAEASRLLTDPQAHAAMARVVHLYGDGKAAERIVNALLPPEGEGRDPLPLPGEKGRSQGGRAG